MKKFLTILTLISVMNASAQPDIRFPIFGKKKHGPRCGSRDNFRKGKRQVIAAVGIFAVSFITAGVIMDKTKAY